ncbi:MAG TPA: bifunctional demethylmenaquinone methyltransferase/2-methoxy-6-polyprenyl-1,4-benzoquinol methylase UbiE [Candidatus Marinimicrobia bacterium]|nr:bifunctional demethylmenaquinone methyltransferase/2-methoxy-6-polyprenyl-1,4-benzoquinol methylase UbiE [Candidatus Neomarinimicrobiota bacterium]
MITDNEAQHVNNVKQIFKTIKDRYDFLNHLLSGRRDIAWRKAVVKILSPDIKAVLDLAAGTGDLTIEIARRFPDAIVLGADFVPDMLHLAVEKSKALPKPISYVAADALCLPFPDNHFDAVTMAFGLRNIVRKELALSEMTRVVKPGGIVAVLEMTLPAWWPARLFFHWYLTNVIPFIGSLISRKPSAYEYLSASIHTFLQPEELSVLFSKAGLINIRAKPLTFGICYLHFGTVAKEPANIQSPSS